MIAYARNRSAYVNQEHEKTTTITKQNREKRCLYENENANGN